MGVTDVCPLPAPGREGSRWICRFCGAEWEVVQRTVRGKTWKKIKAGAKHRKKE